MAKESWYINESELDDYQVNIVRQNLERSFIVKGCAGSGKTVLALWRAKELAERGNHSYLIIVFTKALKQFIQDGVQEVGISSSKVMYFWEWKSARCPSADYIIVDEVQDFDENELRMLRNAARKHLILFGDSAQQLYKDTPGKGRLFTMEEIQTMTRIPMEQLVFNHRLPKKIARVAEEVIATGESITHRCVKEGVDKPRLIHCSSFRDQINYISDVIRSQNYTDVGVLLPTNKDVEEAKRYFDNRGHKVEAKIGYGENSMDLNFHTSYPKLMTYHSAKGLQFEAVFVPISAGSYINRNPLYVALTRSYRDLFVLYENNNLPALLGNISRSLFDIYDERN